MQKNKLITMLFPIFAAVVLAYGFMPPPAHPPVIKASEAANILEGKIANRENKQNNEYIDRMWLIFLNEEDRVWIASVANPKESYRFFKVNMDGAVSELSENERKEVRKIIFGY